jgi:hypothetical protein
MSDFLTNLVEMAWGRAVVAQPQRLSRFEPAPYQAGLLGQKPVFPPAPVEEAAPEQQHDEPTDALVLVDRSAPAAEPRSPDQRPLSATPVRRPRSTRGAIETVDGESKPLSSAAQPQATKRRPAPLPVTAGAPEAADALQSPKEEESSLQRPVANSASQSAPQPLSSSTTPAAQGAVANQTAPAPVATPARRRAGAVLPARRPAAADAIGAHTMLSSNAERAATIRPQRRSAAPAQVEEVEDHLQPPLIASPLAVAPAPLPPSRMEGRGDGDLITPAQDTSARQDGVTNNSSQPGASSAQARPPASRFTVTPQIAPMPGYEQRSEHFTPRIDDKPAIAASSTQPTIHVSIGRVEVRATPPPAAPVRKPSSRPTLSLDDYLRGRKEGSR